MARMAIPMLQAAGLHVGDQLPDSGKLLNATMNRHAEGNCIPYLGIEMRQDLVSDEAGQRKFAGVLATILRECRNSLSCTAHFWHENSCRETDPVPINSTRNTYQDSTFRLGTTLRPPVYILT